MHAFAVHAIFALLAFVAAFALMIVDYLADILRATS